PRSADPTDLPSFPTRRSSDLDNIAITKPGRLRARLRRRSREGCGDVLAHQQTAGATRPRRVGITPDRVVPVDDLAGSIQRRLGLDRKSKRLNSSHVAISYAVC